MKNLRVVFAAIMFMAFSIGSSNLANAQRQTANTGDLVAGLLAVNVSLVEAGVVIGNVTVQDLVDIGDIDINDFITVQNVLNRNQIDILNIQLRDINIDDVLTNVLRDANILNKNQIVVGILSGQLVIQNANFPSKKK